LQGMVVSWINHTLYPTIASSVVYIDNTKTLWDNLKEHFTKGGYFYFLIFFKKFITLSKVKDPFLTFILLLSHYGMI